MKQKSKRKSHVTTTYFCEWLRNSLWTQCDTILGLDFQIETVLWCRTYIAWKQLHSMTVNKYRFISCAKFLWIPPLERNLEKCCRHPCLLGSDAVSFEKISYGSLHKQKIEKTVAYASYFCVRQVTTNHSTKWLSAVFFVCQPLFIQFEVEETQRRKKKRENQVLLLPAKKYVHWSIFLCSLDAHMKHTQLIFLSSELVERKKIRGK